MEHAKENKMGTAAILPLIISMSLPAMASMLVQALYNVVDSIFVAQVSENALTAVSLAFPVQNLLIAFSVGSGGGVNSLVARKLGERDLHAANSAATHGLVMGTLLSVPFILFGLFFSGAFANAFATTEATAAQCADYLRIVSVCSFLVFIQVSCEKILQSTGNMLWPMIMQMTGAVTNIILDPIFIFGYLGLPAMGVTGAAIATVIGQGVGCAIGLFAMFFRNKALKVTLKGFRFHWQTIRNIYSVGIPSMIMQGIGSVMTMSMNTILGGFSETAVAVFGVYFKVQSFVFMPVFGMNAGVAPIMGYNFGARNKKRVLDALKYALIIATTIMGLGMLIMQLFPDKILMIFDASENMMSIGVSAFRAISLCFIPAAIGISFSSLFQATGRGVYSMSISMARQLLMLIPCAFILSKVGGLNATWYAFPLAEIIAIVLSVVFFLSLKRKVIDKLDEPVRRME
ncbi:MAG: MATE family efflux transporter [Clostridia bacterium]|nr:MATE family efflux transporter [Clostridia bacterium]